MLLYAPSLFTICCCSLQITPLHWLCEEPRVRWHLLELDKTTLHCTRYALQGLPSISKYTRASIWQTRSSGIDSKQLFLKSMRLSLEHPRISSGIETILLSRTKSSSSIKHSPNLLGRDASALLEASRMISEVIFPREDGSVVNKFLPSINSYDSVLRVSSWNLKHHCLTQHLVLTCNFGKYSPKSCGSTSIWQSVSLSRRKE
jgi:hypothetical protein